MEIRRYSRAIEILTLGLDIYPDADSLYFVLALVHMKNGDREQALENIQQSLKLNPENQPAKNLLNDLKSI